MAKGILQRLAEGPVIGDGGMVTIMEKRGYARAGLWGPEACVEHPYAVTQLHREFLRAGSDVLQAFTFYASDDRVERQGNKTGIKFNARDINLAACKLVKEVAAEGSDILLAGSISKVPTYDNGKGEKAKVQAEFKKQIDVLVDNGMDFIICEFFEHVEEIVWAIEMCAETGLPVAGTLCIGVDGDHHGVSSADCAVRMAKAGASLVGVNCYFDPFQSLKTLSLMKTGLEAAGLLNKPTYLMAQPVGFMTPDAGFDGYDRLPEFPFCLEPRMCTRFDIKKYAREAFELGVRYIGGCCGFEPHHIRAISEELCEERGGKTAPGSEKSDPWGAALVHHAKQWTQDRANRRHWENLKPASGRPTCPSMSGPQNAGKRE
jgi:betaine-homocysteine S-methyltransferase